jgi:hypothetical protein
LQISFAGATDAMFVIQPLSPLPRIVGALHLYAPLSASVVLDGRGGQAMFHGLEVDTPSEAAVVVEGLTLRGFGRSGLMVRGAGHVVRNVTAADNAEEGVLCQAANTLVADCVLVNNSHTGLLASGRNTTVQGCFVGVTRTGEVRGNYDSGLLLLGACPHIGGVLPSQRNIVSGNLGYGVFTARAAVDAVIEGNFVGIAATGITAVANAFDGLHLEGSGARVGDGTADARNIISGNQHSGVFATGSWIRICGNYIGLDSTGSKSIQNRFDGAGIYGDNHVIGGSTPGERNVIAGNKGNGIVLGGLHA